MPSMFNRILIANRGEIACRVIDTCQRLGIATVAVYSEADRYARHVRLADEAVCIGPPPAAESYLAIERILAAAKDRGAEAVHPGYGFLSENAGFSRACDEAGIVFIGPCAQTIEAMGSKSQAKHLIESAGVPTVPGWHGNQVSAKQLYDQAQRLGFPLMIKAIAGGGGKGMRVVHAAEEFDEALDGARREARNAFGDDRILLERYLEHPRHIEFQVFGDHQGNVVHLFERECSIQRRYQKIIEESPSPFIDDTLRAQMGQAAINAARAVNYLGAGTVEFIVDAERRFYFMEMNTRLQVEHPVTEMITGLDLVEWQLRVAAGEPLPLAQEQIPRRGHAIEARLYAENPAREFLPASGRIEALLLPPASDGIRVDRGVATGDHVGTHYDPMLAKLIVWDEHRDAATVRLKRALAHTALFGIGNNLEFLAAVAALPEFTGAAMDTGFIDRHVQQLAAVREKTPATAWITAAAHLLLARQEQAQALARRSGEPGSPWHQRDGWQLNGHCRQQVPLQWPGKTTPTPLTASPTGNGWMIEHAAQQYQVTAIRRDQDALSLHIDGQPVQAIVLQHGTELIVTVADNRYQLSLVQARAQQGQDESSLTAPMPGRIIRVHVTAGTQVAANTALLVLEAMKMEYTVRAPCAGRIEQVLFNEGDTVTADAPLVEFLPDE